MQLKEDNLTVEVTEKAIVNIKRFVEGDDIVRVGVRGGGCSGLSYILEFEDAKSINFMMDHIIEKDGIQIVIDKKSMVYLAGTTLDYADGLSGKGFTFLNPNAKQSCGCGESFTL
jgi:iron-sulfur cluster assembly protein